MSLIRTWLMFVLACGATSAYAACSSWIGKAWLNEYFYGTSTTPNFIELFSADKNFPASWSGWSVRVYSGTDTYTTHTYDSNTATACTLPGNRTYVTYPVPGGLSGTEGMVVLFDNASPPQPVDAFVFDQNAPPSPWNVTTKWASTLANIASAEYCPTLSNALSTQSAAATRPYYGQNMQIWQSQGNKDYGRSPDGAGIWTDSSQTGGNTTFTVCSSNKGAIEKTVNKAFPAPGESITWTVTITNNGKNDLSGVKVDDRYYKTSTATANMSCTTPTVTLGSVAATATGTAPTTPSGMTEIGAYGWTIGTLAKNVTAMLTMNCTIPASAAVDTVYRNDALTTTGVSPSSSDWSQVTVADAGPNHIRVFRDNNLDALTCAPRTLSAVACNDPNCTSRYGTSVSLTLNPGGTATTIPVNGTGSPMVAQSTAGTVGVTLNSSTPVTTGTPNFRCYSGTVAAPGSEITGACNITFGNAGLFVAVPHHRSCDTSTLTITAARTDDVTKRCVPAFDGASNRDIRLRFAYATPATGTLVPTVGGATPPTIALATGSDQTLALAFTNGVATTNFRYQDAGSLTVTAGYTGSAATGDAGLTLNTVSNPAFVVAPQSFAISGIPAAPLVAGSPFNVTVTAKNNCSPSVATPNFTGTMALSSSNPQPGLGNATAINQNLTVSSSGTASTNLTWNEVGTFDLNAITNDYLGSGLNVTGSQLAVGRFKPGYFDTIVTPGCIGNFTYAGLSGTPSLPGQPFTVEVKAKRTGGDNNDNTNTANYAGATWAKNVTLSDAAGGSGTLSNNTTTAASFAAGKATRTDVLYAFPAKQTAPYTLSVRAIDSDTPAVSSSGHAEGSTAMRSGQLRLFNAFGPASGSLTMQVQAQYWSGSSWVLNSGDSCTILPANAFYLTGGPAATTTASVLTLVGGNGTLTLTNTGGTGSVDVAANLGTSGLDQSCLASHGGTATNRPWLRSRNGSCVTAYDRDPAARATFGVYAPETRKSIHVREEF